MSALQSWVADAVEPRTADELFWVLTGGDYTVVEDPVSLGDLFRADYAQGDVRDPAGAIAWARQRSGACPVCLLPLPLHQGEGGVRTVFACESCDWRAHGGEERGLLPAGLKTRPLFAETVKPHRSYALYLLYLAGFVALALRALA